SINRSENHAETETGLRALREKKMKPNVDGTRVCVCENSNVDRNLVPKVFGEAGA
ncbi:hypothetical protein L915_00394, partial [Phytophthora nicotianae]